MAHYNHKATVRLLSKIRNGYATYLRNLATSGVPGDVIEYVNGVSVVMDVETLLGRALSTAEATSLLRSPESTTAEYGHAFGLAHIRALNLKHARQSLRSMLREHRIKEVTDLVERLATDVNAYAA